MNLRTLVSNTAFAFLSQSVSFIASIVTSLLVPKVLGIEEYGYWQLFIFYVAYVGFFSLGAVDGIYLIHGGEQRGAIDKKDVISQYWVSAAYVTAFSLIMGLIGSLLLFNGKRVEVIAFVSLYSILSHLAGSLGIILQTMNETRAYSRSVMIDRGSFVVLLAAPLFLHINSFEIYCILFIVAKVLSFLYCLCKMIDFMRVGVESLPVALRLTWRSIQVGIKLMLANIASTLILGVARASVDFAWGIESFAKVSLALSMVNFFLAFVTQASMVLFPALRQGTKAEQRSFYRGIRDMMEVSLPGIFLLYYPVVWMLTLWLPQYSASMHYFAILLPLCAFDSKMSICCTTYLKVLRKEQILLRVNILTVLGSAILSLVSIYVLSSLDMVLFGAIACIIGRSLWCEYYLNGKLGVSSTWLPLQELALTIGFIVLALYATTPIAICSYTVMYASYLLLNRGTTCRLIALVKSMFSD